MEVIYKELFKGKTQSFTERLKRLGKITILQSKFIISSGIILFMLFLMPIILLFGVGTLIRESNIFVPSIGISQVIIIGIIFGNLNYSINDSSISKNLTLSKVSWWQRIVSMFLVIFFFSFLSFVFQMIIFVSFESLEWVFMLGFSFEGDASYYSRDIIWANVSWLAVFMYYFQTLILTFSIYLVISGIFNNKKTFTVFVFSYMIAFLTLGGIMSCHWGYYNSITNESLATQYGTLARQTLDVSTINYNDTPAYNPNVWVNYVPFFLPQWYTNQHFFYTVAAGADSQSGEILNEVIQKVDGVDYSVHGLYDSYPPQFTFMFWSKYDWYWNYSLLAPYVYTVVLTLIGIILKTNNIFKRVKN